MATYFWVGGSGTWDNSSTANWATSTGGAGGNGPPLAADTVNFDANSGTAATVTVAATAVSANAIVNKSDINLSLSGSPTLCTGTLTLTTGTITLNTHTLTTGIFSSSNTNTRTVAFGTGQITLTSSGTTIWSVGTATNFVSTGTPNVVSTYAGAVGTRTLSHGGTTGGTEANSVSFSITGGSDIVVAITAIRNLNFTGFSGTFSSGSRLIFGDLTLSATMTVAASGSTTTFSATSGTQRVTTNGVIVDLVIAQNNPGAVLQLQDNLTQAATRNFTLTAGTLDLTGNSGNWTLTTNVVSSSNSNTRAIAFGTGQIIVTANATTVWSMGTLAGFSYTGTPNVVSNYAGSTGTRTISHGGTSGGTEANAVSISVTAGSDAVAVLGTLKNLIFTGFAGTLNSNNRTLYGNLTLGAGMTIAASASNTTFAATSGVQQITSNGKTLDLPLVFNGVGGTFAFQDALTQGSTRAFTIINGTVQLRAGATSTVGAFTTSGANQKFLQSTAAGTQATLSQASGTVSANFLTVRDINATGGATWNAFYSNGNNDAGNNTGWNFGGTPAVSTEVTYALRSFTTPRRF